MICILVIILRVKRLAFLKVKWVISFIQVVNFNHSTRILYILLDLLFWTWLVFSITLRCTLLLRNDKLLSAFTFTFWLVGCLDRRFLALLRAFHFVVWLLRNLWKTKIAIKRTIMATFADTVLLAIVPWLWFQRFLLLVKSLLVTVWRSIWVSALITPIAILTLNRAPSPTIKGVLLCKVATPL